MKRGSEDYDMYEKRKKKMNETKKKRRGKERKR